MLCCVGLFGGLSVGQALGGSWAVVAPAAGFGLGLIGDMKLMRHMHGRPTQQAEGSPERSAERSACAVHELLRRPRRPRPDGVQVHGPERESSAVLGLHAPERSDEVDEPRVVRGA